MRKYRVSADVEYVRGWQTWIIEAESKEEAIDKVQCGEGEFEDEELEVHSCDAYEAEEIKT